MKNHDPRYTIATNYRRGCKCADCVAGRNAYEHKLRTEGRTSWRGTDLIEEVMWLWNSRVTEVEIADRLGVKVTSIQRAFYRHQVPIPWVQHKSSVSA